MLTKKMIVGHMTIPEAEKKIKECKAMHADVSFKRRGENVLMVIRSSTPLAQVC